MTAKETARAHHTAIEIFDSIRQQDLEADNA
jgi:hypothetical protein